MGACTDACCWLSWPWSSLAEVCLILTPGFTLGRVKRVFPKLSDAAEERVVAHVYLTTTSTAMADDRSWEREYCRDRWYRAPTDEERAKLQVHRTCSAAAVVIFSAAL